MNRNRVDDILDMYRTPSGVPTELRWMAAEIDRLRAELANLRGLIDAERTVSGKARARAWEAEGRLAAVIALCDATHGADARLYAAHVRAAATGDMK